MNKIDELAKLVELLKAGSISKEEFEMLKGEILNNDENIIEPKKVEKSNWQMSQPILSQPSDKGEGKKLSHLEEKAAREQRWAEEDKADSQKSMKAISKWVTTIAVIVGIIVFIATFLDNNSKSKNSATEANNISTNAGNVGSSYVSYTKCSICGRQFTGNGYEEVSDGVWKLCKDGEQSSICSPGCGMVHTSKMNNLMQKAGVSTKCSHCGLGTYQNGYCNYCGAASPERVNETYRNMPKCQGCNGTGWRDNEVCPLCDGKGVQVY